MSSTWRKATASQGPRFRFVHRFVANLPHHLELVPLVAVPSSFEAIDSFHTLRRSASCRRLFFGKIQPFKKNQRKLDQMKKWCKIYINVSLNVEIFRPYQNSKPVFKRLPGCFGESHSWSFRLPRLMSSSRRSQVFGVEVFEFHFWKHCFFWKVIRTKHHWNIYQYLYWPCVPRDFGSKTSEVLRSTFVATVFFQQWIALKQ